ncbi:hypothetical protein Xkoz_03832 [Xenorhabdus kozodoii]|uniref:Uncharacterized protein n=1 Tax=Xenorhabdus kozodoii TaxID=351676 RepID=A0A2D0KT71_9GAMM|nr:hypothetical protein Xkoz_03832 [Xenorhabdus kozodoii]
MDKAVMKLNGVEARNQAGNRIMPRYSIRKKFFFLIPIQIGFTEIFNIFPPFRSGDDGSGGQKKDIEQRITDLRKLARIC